MKPFFEISKIKNKNDVLDKLNLGYQADNKRYQADNKIYQAKIVETDDEKKITKFQVFIEKKLFDVNVR